MNYYTSQSYKPTFFAEVSEESITEPNQAYSIRELLIRFANGTLPPLANYSNYGEEDDYITPSNEQIDLSDIPTRYQERENTPIVQSRPASTPVDNDNDNNNEPNTLHNNNDVTLDTKDTKSND